MVQNRKSINKKKPKKASSSKSARAAALASPAKTAFRKALLRHVALRRVTDLLLSGNSLPREALSLITRFDFHSDDLTEAGLSYEIVRALEKRYPGLLAQD